MSFQNFDTTNSGGMGGYPGYGYGGGYGMGTGIGAFGGALVGGLIGDALWSRDGRGCGGYGGYGGGCGYPATKEVVQINENGGRRGWGGDCGEWNIFKEVSDDRREQVQQTVSLQEMGFGLQRDVLEKGHTAAYATLNAQIATDARFAALQQQICCCCNETDRLILEGQYKSLLESAGLSREICECCCKQLTATMEMGYQTQIRDITMNYEGQLREQKAHGELMAEIGSVKCLIENTAKDGRIAALEGLVGKLGGEASEARIFAAIKDATTPKMPIPSYAAANPYEQYVAPVRLANHCPTEVRVSREHNHCGPCNPVWNCN